MTEQELDTKLAEIRKHHPWFSSDPKTPQTKPPAPIPRFSAEIEELIEEVGKVHPWFTR